MSNSAIPTISSLVKQKIQEKGLSTGMLVQSIGYTNVSKGARRLKNFLQTLDAPSEEFIVNLLSVLDIDCPSFNKSIKKTLEQFSNDAERKFKPFIRIKLGIEVSPAFAAQMVYSKCGLPLPAAILEKPFSEEIDAVTALYKEFTGDAKNENLARHVIGFHYHRQHNYYLRFNADFVMEEIVAVQPRPPGKAYLGNTIANMLS